jgi:hypothetical protein
MTTLVMGSWLVVGGRVGFSEGGRVAVQRSATVLGWSCQLDNYSGHPLKDGQCP